LMRVAVHFYSYFKDLAGCSQWFGEVPEGCAVGELLDCVLAQFPKLAPMKRSMLIAVDVEYQPLNYVLKPGEAVSLFPPVQGG
jgi:molybdopterin converting factor small subunit